MTKSGHSLGADEIGTRIDGAAVFSAPSERIRARLRDAGFAFCTWKAKPTRNQSFATIRGWAPADDRFLAPGG